MGSCGFLWILVGSCGFVVDCFVRVKRLLLEEVSVDMLVTMTKEGVIQRRLYLTYPPIQVT